MDVSKYLQRTMKTSPAADEDQVMAYQPDLLRLAYAILGDPAEADEAVQDALVAALQGLDDYRGQAALKTWLYRITINICSKRLRKRQARRRLNHALQMLFQLGVGPAHPEDSLIRDETRSRVRRAINALDDKHRLPVMLFYDHELSVAEIAQALGVPTGTVLSRLHHAREKLRLALQDELGPCLEEEQ